MGYMLEVDLEYPQHLHDLHNDYPFCSEHLNVGKSEETKLVCTLNNNKNYVIHYRMLKLAIEHGLKITKLHNILQFKQSTWLKDYIMLNTRERTKSNTEFEKNLYKLMNNAIFGKSMENVRKRVDIRLINKWDGRHGMQSQIAKPTFKRSIIFNPNLVACELARLNIDFKKPVIVGSTILDISKTLMYTFHYNFMLPNFGREHCRIMYTDTDSFMYETDKDIYAFIRNYPDFFDTSDYAIDNVYGIQQRNKKVVGIMKDENCGKIVKEFIGLRSKMYTYKMHEKLKVKKRGKIIEKRKVIKKAKGVKKNVINKKISFNDYKCCIATKLNLIRTQKTFRSHLHKLYTVSNKKNALDPNDDKRYIIPGTNETLAWGHYKIKQ